MITLPDSVRLRAARCMWALNCFDLSEICSRALREAGYDGPVRIQHWAAGVDVTSPEHGYVSPENMELSLSVVENVLGDHLGRWFEKK